MKDSEPIFRISRAGFQNFLSPARIRRLRAQFAERPVLRLPGFLDEALLAQAQKMLAASGYYDFRDFGFDRRQRPNRTDTDIFLTLLFNVPDFFSALESLTGAPRLSAAKGQVYRMGAGDFLRWHTDNDGLRQCSITVNLGNAPFSGGLFEFRRKPAGPASRYEYGPPGDALLFRIAPEFQHRSAPVVGEIPKLIFSCWFTTAKLIDGPFSFPGALQEAA